MKFRKKPGVIEAERTSVLIHNAAHDWKALPPWFVAAYGRGEILILNTSIEIATLEGTMVAQHADMVICGVKGELYPCKPDIFAATYEPEGAPREGGREP